MGNANYPAIRGRGPSQLLGVLLIVGGMMWLLAAIDLLVIPLQVVLAALLVVLGAGMIITRSSGIFILAGVTAIGGLVLASTDVEFRFGDVEGAGERVIAPKDVSALAPEYRLGAGTLTLDLSELQMPDGVTDLQIRMGMGEMKIIVPMGVDIEGDASVGGGEVIAFQETLGSGVTVAADLSQQGSSPATLRLDLRLVMGTIEISRG